MNRPKRVDKRELVASEPVVAAYIRVSSPSQDYAYQRHAIETAARARGELVEQWYADIGSGSTMERPELVRMRHDVDRLLIKRLWVWRLDRLSRSGIVDMFGVVDQIRGSGATLASVADGFALEPGPAGEIMLAMIAWAAEQERIKIRENQEAARRRMLREGRNWGRPRLPDTKRDAIVAASSRGKSRKEIARELQISRSSVDKVLRSLSRGMDS